MAVLEEGGWLPVKEIHKILCQVEGVKFLTPAILRQFIDTYRPDQFQIEGDRVRVHPQLQGPNIFFMDCVSPPETLYLPVRPKSHAHVLKHGISPASNKLWIVLATEKKSAVVIGKRRDADPVIAAVDCIKAESRGTLFFKGDGELYMATFLEPEWLSLPPLPEKDEYATVETDKRKESGGSPGLKQRPEVPESPMVSGSFFPSGHPSFINKSKPGKGLTKRHGGKKSEPAWKKERRQKRRR